MRPGSTARKPLAPSVRAYRLQGRRHTELLPGRGQHRQMGKSATSIRFAAVGDIHVNKDSSGTLRGFFGQACEAADALLLCGDLTDYGTEQEARILADELHAVSIPIVAVLGNHDYESGIPERVTAIL